MASPESYIGSISMFAGDFAPKGWALCKGQLLPVAQYQALFSILGTIYGGDGRTTFALPNLCGRVPLGPGNGPGLTPRTIGESSGAETVTLLPTQIPPHSHLIQATTNAASTNNPNGNFLATTTDSSGGTTIDSYANAGANTTLNPQSISVVGGGQPHENMQPYLAINFIICLEGVYPSRN